MCHFSDDPLSVREITLFFPPYVVVHPLLQDTLILAICQAFFAILSACVLRSTTTQKIVHSVFTGYPHSYPHKKNRKHKENKGIARQFHISTLPTTTTKKRTI